MKKFTLDYQQIRKSPILDIAARFWEPERYEAFRVCYASMRIIDDLVDDRKTQGVLSDAEKIEMTEVVKDWLKSLSTPSDKFRKQLLEVIKKFQIPLTPWQLFGEAMIYDVNNDGFKNFKDYISYAEGAAVAPASIFMHLCGVKKQDQGFIPPGFDIVEAARPIALYAYLAHIIRDFQKDQNDNLSFFADNLIAKSGLKKSQLKEIAEGSKIPLKFRSLMKIYLSYAENYRKKARKMIDKLSPHLQPEYRLSIEIIYTLYLQILERINVKKGSFTTKELNPTPQEIKERIRQTISAFS
ncbi:MAG: squalene/phytoene synthase family protein [Candidatus Woesearchaeota archaeon]